MQTGRQRHLWTAALLSATLMGLAGCGTQVSDSPSPSVPSLPSTTIKAVFQRDHLNPGITLGYRNRLYQLVRPVPFSAAGDKLGTVLYHGNIGQGFVLYAAKGKAVRSTILFRAETGQYFEGIAANRASRP